MALSCFLGGPDRQPALAGGLGRWDLSFDMFIWAEARVAIAKNKAVSRVIFFIVFSS